MNPFLTLEDEGGGTLPQWLETLGLKNFLSQYPASLLVEWGWLKPYSKVALSKPFIDQWNKAQNDYRGLLQQGALALAEHLKLTPTALQDFIGNQLLVCAQNWLRRPTGVLLIEMGEWWHGHISRGISSLRWSGFAC